MWCCSRTMILGCLQNQYTQKCYSGIKQTAIHSLLYEYYIEYVLFKVAHLNTLQNVIMDVLNSNIIVKQNNAM